ncbi:MAG: hypothetical protein ACTSXP_08305, partial [Promethearchaeota archaeon]
MYAIYLIIGGLAIYPIYSSHKKSYEPIKSIMIKILLVIIILTSVSYLLYWFFEILLQIPEPTIGYNLKFSYITGFLTMVVQLLFLMHVHTLKRFYSLGFVWVFYTVIALYQVESTSHVVVSTTILSATLIIFFIRLGLKKRNGEIISFGFYCVCYVFGEFLHYPLHMDVWFIKSGLPGSFLGFICINLGSWGILDKILFRISKSSNDTRVKHNNHAISGTFDVKSIKINNKRDLFNISKFRRRKNVFIECPVCAESGFYTCPAEVLKNRHDQDSGLISMVVPGGAICPHEFVVYLDKKLDVKGYNLNK